MDVFLKIILQILMSVLRILMCAILMPTALTQLAVTTVPALLVTLGMEKSVVRKEIACRHNYLYTKLFDFYLVLFLSIEVYIKIENMTTSCILHISNSMQ